MNISVRIKCANKNPEYLFENEYIPYDHLELNRSELPTFDYYLDYENVEFS